MWSGWRVIGMGVVGLLVGVGCTRTVEHKVARVRPGKGAGVTVRGAPVTALYEIRVRGKSGDEYERIPGTATLLRRGDAVGFEVDEEGNLRGVAGENEFDVGAPPGWRKMMWYASYTEQTQFGRGVREGMDAMVKGAVVGGLWVAEGMMEDDDDEDEDDWFYARAREIEKVKKGRRGREYP